MVTVPGTPVPYTYTDDRKRIRTPRLRDRRLLRHQYAVVNMTLGELREWCHANHRGYVITSLAWAYLVQFIQYQDAMHFKLRWSNNIVQISPDMFETKPWYAPAGPLRGWKPGQLNTIVAGTNSGKSMFNQTRV
ncbi:MAG: hypothetical protein EOP83_00250 [Verrucomicrobiaceae bacterium]|nr:MAG: hypothetical protein EOP83_00250 [Verrucomicrobiaceae bacterium]